MAVLSQLPDSGLVSESPEMLMAEDAGPQGSGPGQPVQARPWALWKCFGLLQLEWGCSWLASYHSQPGSFHSKELSGPKFHCVDVEKVLACNINREISRS